MKCILRGYGINMTNQERQVARSQAKDMTIARGTDRRPLAPRDVFLQSGPRGILVNFRAGAGFNGDLAGFRVYKDDESSLFAEIKDPSTTQHYIDATAGSAPPVVNIFVSAFSKLGRESPLVQAQGSSLVEAGAPAMPGTPSTYTGGFTKTNTSSGGGNRRNLE